MQFQHLTNKCQLCYSPNFLICDADSSHLQRLSFLPPEENSLIAHWAISRALAHIERDWSLASSLLHPSYFACPNTARSTIHSPPPYSASIYRHEKKSESFFGVASSTATPSPGPEFSRVQDLMLHLCLPSSRSPLRQCLRFYPLQLAWIFAESLLFKNPKSTRSSSILLAFLTIPPRHVGPCMLSPRRNALPKLSPTPKTPLPQHTLEFGIIPNSQHLKSKSSFFALTTLSDMSKVHVASGSTNSL